jgi:hypothetical protein
VLFPFHTGNLAKSSGIQVTSIYRNEINISIPIKTLFGLGFFTISKVQTRFNLLFSRADERLLPVFRFFNHQWIQTIGPKHWNDNDKAIRTNNNIEDRHNRFNKLVEGSHANIYKFMTD